MPVAIETFIYHRLKNMTGTFLKSNLKIESKSFSNFF